MTKTSAYVNTVATLQAADLFDVSVSPFGSGDSQKLPYSVLLTNLNNDLDLFWEFSFGTLKPKAAPVVIGITLENAAKTKEFIITNTDTAAVFNVELSYKFTHGGITALEINELDLVYGPQSDGKAFVLNDAADVESVAFTVGSDAVIDMSQSGGVVNKIATGVDSYLYDGIAGNFGIGITPTEKLHIQDGNILMSVVDATGGSPITPSGIIKMESKYFDATSITIPMEMSYTNETSPIFASQQPILDLTLGGSIALKIDESNANYVLGNNTNPTGFSNFVFGRNNSTSAPANDVVQMGGSLVTGGSGCIMVGSIMTLTNINIFAFGQNITEARANMYVAQFPAASNKRRINFEVGAADALTIRPQKAVVTGGQQVIDNQGIQMVSSYWDGALNQDTTGYISHFIVDQPTGRAVLSLGNQSNQHVAVIDVNGAFRIGEDAHSLPLFTPQNEGLLVYKNFGGLSTSAVARFINPMGVEDTFITLDNSNLANFNIKVLNGAGAMTVTLRVDAAGSLEYVDKNAVVTVLALTT